MIFLIITCISDTSTKYLRTERGTTIVSAIQSKEVGWEVDGLQSVFCVSHIASNFNMKFKNAEVMR